MSLSALIERSKASNAELASDTGLHPTLIWKYRKGQVRPGPDNGALLVGALRRRGLAVELADVLGVKRSKRRAA